MIAQNTESQLELRVISFLELRLTSRYDILRLVKDIIALRFRDQLQRHEFEQEQQSHSPLVFAVMGTTDFVVLYTF